MVKILEEIPLIMKSAQPLSRSYFKYCSCNYYCYKVCSSLLPSHTTKSTTRHLFSSRIRFCRKDFLGPATAEASFTVTSAYTYKIIFVLFDAGSLTYEVKNLIFIVISCTLAHRQATQKYSQKRITVNKQSPEVSGLRVNSLCCPQDLLVHGPCSLDHTDCDTACRTHTPLMY
jgi:hypothetical protein